MIQIWETEPVKIWHFWQKSNLYYEFDTKIIASKFSVNQVWWLINYLGENAWHSPASSSASVKLNQTVSTVFCF